MTVHQADSMRGGLRNTGSLQPTSFTQNALPPLVTSALPLLADSEASRTAGDMNLAKAYAAQLATGSRLQIPPASTLGRWLEVLKSAFDSPILKSLREMGDVTAIEIDPGKGEIRFKVRGVLVEEPISLVDMPGGLGLFDSLIAIAKALIPNGVLSLPTYFKDDTVALSDVQRFYGEPAHLTMEQTIARSKQLTHHPVFQGQGSLPDNNVRLDVLRKIGDAHTLHTLLTVLKEQVENPGPNLDLVAAPVEIAPHSVLWDEQQKQPVTLSLQQLIIHYGLQVPATLDEVANLERTLSAPPLRAPSEGNYGGLLSKDVPLDADDQKKIIATVNAWKALQTHVPRDKDRRSVALLDYLQRALATSVSARVGDDPEAFLKALINTPQARALGKQLQEAIGALPTQTSAQEALLAALGLEADPAAAQQRNNLAGYNLRQPDNWGLPPAQIVKRFEQHLEKRFGAPMAKVVAYQMLAMSAPEFLVKDVPSSLVYGSQQWASFSTAVTRREQDTPGSSAGHTYAHIMLRDALDPVTALAQSQLQFAAMRSVIDWGIANGVIEPSRDDAYSAETIDRAVVALQKQVDAMVDAAKAFAAPVPTRRDMALAELRRVYGVENERFFEQSIVGDLPPGSRKRGTLPLLDIYMSGELYKHDWTSSDPGFSTVTLRAGFSRLANIKIKFDEAFSDYSQRLRMALGTQFQYEVSQLPLDDRQMIARGSVTGFHVASAGKGKGTLPADHPMADYVKNGAMLIRSELGGKTRHYLYSPSKGQILKDSGLSTPGMEKPGSRLLFSMVQPGQPGEPAPPVTFLWPAPNSESPSKGTFDFSVLRIHPQGSPPTQLPEPHPVPRTDAPSARINALTAVVSDYFGRALDDVKKTSHGETLQERDKRINKAAKGFLLGLIPLYDATKSFIDGKPLEGFLYTFLDIVGLLLPAFKGGSHAIRAGSKGVGATLSFLKGFAKAGLKAANPLAGVYDIGRGVFNLGKAGFKPLSKTSVSLWNDVRHARGHSGSFDIPKAGTKDNIAEGIYRPNGAGADGVPALAVQRNGKWYAYDQINGLPYGAPLKGFTPSAWSGVGHRLVDTVVDTAIDAALDFGVGVAFQLASRRVAPRPFQLPSAPPQADLERQSATERVGRIADQTFFARAETLRLTLLQVEKDLAGLAGGEAQDAGLGLEERSTDIFEQLDRIDTALDSLEERVAERAHLCEVFFTPHVPVPVDPLDINARRLRLDAIEARLALVNRALRDIEAHRESAA